MRIKISPATAQSVSSRTPLWRLAAFCSVVVLSMCLPLGSALALGLGKVNIISALGEPLNAEIEVPQITPDEVASLRATVASPEAFKAAGMDYSPALKDTQISLQKRNNGNYFLRLTSTRPVTDPFVDLILESSWASGKLVRDYTMLFDPPNLRAQAAPANVLPAAVPAPSPVSQAGAASPALAPASTPIAAPAPSIATGSSAGTVREVYPSSATRENPRTQAKAARPVASPAAPKASAKPASATASKLSAEKSAQRSNVKVKSGDTAAEIALRYKPKAVSLDQMLVSMLRSNPDAFIEGNVNRLKNGAVLDMQSAANSASDSPTAEAKQTIVAQARDFDDFRRRLASGVPLAAIRSNARASSGKVEARVSEPKPQANAANKLTLSKGSVGSKANTPANATTKEDLIAKNKSSQENNARLAELNKNISELNKLSAASAAKTAPPAATSPSAASSATAASTAKSGSTTISLPSAKLDSAALAAAAGAAAAALSSSSSNTTRATATTTATSTVATPVAASKSSAPVETKPSSAVVSTSAASTTSTTSDASSLAKVTSTTPLASSKTERTSQGTSTAASISTASAPAVSTPAAAASSAVAESKPANKPQPAPTAPVSEPSFFDSLTDNPLLPAGAAAVLAGLGGLAYWRSRQRKKAGQVDSSFLESRLQPDSFFGASGGQRVDTADAAPAGSSMVYSPSQLDAAGDVDPVAEADVYLAYGRDLQAEEILKEAMRTNPSRLAVHSKLMEIYAKRRDTRGFESVAKEAFNLTQGHGPEWQAASELGRGIDPDNALYQSGAGLPVAGVSSGTGLGAAAAVTGLAAAAVGAGLGSRAKAEASALSSGAFNATIPVKSSQVAEPEVDVDFDLDFSASGIPLEMANAAQVAHDAHQSSTNAVAAAQLTDFSTSLPPELGADAFSADLDALSNQLNFNQMSLPHASPPTMPVAMNTQPSSAPQALEFDLGGLSLDLGAAPIAASVATSAMVATQAIDAGVTGDPLETKIALAMEFRDIGDLDGARVLMQEVVAESAGALKSRASKILADLG